MIIAGRSGGVVSVLIQTARVKSPYHQVFAQILRLTPAKGEFPDLLAEYLFLLKQKLFHYIFLSLRYSRRPDQRFNDRITWNPFRDQVKIHDTKHKLLVGRGGEVEPGNGKIGRKFYAWFIISNYLARLYSIWHPASNVKSAETMVFAQDLWAC